LQFHMEVITGLASYVAAAVSKKLLTQKKFMCTIWNLTQTIDSVH
jgi:hypothetical protein